MFTKRRDFIRLTAAAGGALGLGIAPDVFGRTVQAASKPLKMLILGGTGFTGPHQVQYALDRGHQVTLFNRGRTRPGLFKGKVEELIGDRNLAQVDPLKGREWDVVIDNPTTLPFWVRDVGQVLKDHTKQYMFISTISVYADNSQPGMDETTVLEQYEGADALAETMDTFRQSGGRLYGPLKVKSEEEAEKWFPGRTTIIRPGLIVGPGDPTDRFTYWPVRIDRGGEVLAPGDPSDPVQFIDGRDLAEWTIRMAENGHTGIYNATGPREKLGVGGMLEGIEAANGGDARFTFVPADFLREQNVRPWGDMPVWIPPIGDTTAFAQVSIQRALDEGLTFRPLATTARETLAWWKSEPEERRTRPLRAGIAPDREKEVLAAWHARKTN